MRTSKFFNPATSWLRQMFEYKVRLGRFHTKMLARTVIILLVFSLGLLHKRGDVWVIFFTWYVPCLVVFIREVARYYWPPGSQWAMNVCRRIANCFRDIPIALDELDKHSCLCINCGRPKLFDELIPSAPEQGAPDKPICTKCPVRNESVRTIFIDHLSDSDFGTDSYLPPGAKEAFRDRVPEEHG